MATKSTTKSPARKAATTARRPAKSVPQKEAPPKAKESKTKAAEKPERPIGPAKEKGAPARVTGEVPETIEEKPKSVSKMESVSLIDKPKAKSTDGVPKVRTTILPPISKLVAKPGLTAPPPPPVVEPPPPAPAPVAEGAAVSSTDGQASEVAPPVEEEPKNVITIKPPIIAKELATQLGMKNFQLIKELMDDFNIFVNANQTIEPDVATKIAERHGYFLEKERREKGGGVHKEEKVIVAPPPPEPAKEEELKPRAHKGQPITFLDTPGHAAFTAMRARGASVTDVVVLVVAADDGLMPQTIEAINHAKAAPHVKIMVAINKIDLASANIDRVKKQLQERELTPEDWGGETITVPVSATRGTNIDQLLEMMTLQAEVMELKASPTAKPRGTVIEAQVEAGRGPTATVIVQMGTLRVGDAFICGDYSGKVKSLIDDRGQPVKAAGPSMPVKVLGFTGLPNAGDELLVMDSEREAKQLSEERRESKRAGKLATPQRATLETLLEAADGKKVLRIVLKTDVQGSLEALTGALNQIESKKVDLEIIHAGVGPISENDILLASASNAVVVGFNVKVENMAVTAAKHEGVQVKLYSIIYELLDQIKEAMAGLLDPEHRESVIGHAEVKQIFQLSRGIVAGCLVTDGRIARTARARVLRRRQPVYDGGLATLRRFQDDVKEVRSGLECGIKLGDFSEYQVGDIIECYMLEQIAQKL